VRTHATSSTAPPPPPPPENMDIYKLCKDEKLATSAQFYNSAITVISVLIGCELLLFCACILILRRASSDETKAEEHSSNTEAWSKLSWIEKLRAICMHGIISTKGYFSVTQFRKVFLMALAPARYRASLPSAYSSHLYLRFL
jgi:hypothetical protein